MEKRPLSLNVKLCEQGDGSGRAPAWFVCKQCVEGEEWIPLWKHDSDLLEEHFQRGEHDIEIPIRHHHAVANIASRTVTESYYLNPKTETLRRGTWFWEKVKGKMVPFSESTAEAIEHWTAAVKLSTSALEGRWHHDLGEVMGPGKGQFTIVAKLVHAEVIIPAEGGKSVTKDVEVLSPKSSEIEISKAIEDSKNRFVFELENRTNLLMSILSGSKVESGYDLPVHPDERICNIRPGHLVFIVHGIGEAMFSQEGSPAPSIQACTEKFRAMSLESTHPTATDATPFDIHASDDSQDGKMVEYIAIEWWNAVHGEDSDLSRQLKLITAPTVPLMRQFGNTAAMDILLYQTPEFQHRITTSVCTSMNHAYRRFCELNPDFNGDCSIIGHSLGSVITFDILSSQFVTTSEAPAEPSAPPLEAAEQLSEAAKEEVDQCPACNNPTDALYASQSYMTEGRNTEKIAAQQLVFQPKAFFAIGSPIGMFFTVRSKGQPFPSDFKLPSCPQMFNIFHPHDPVAYRLEPLFDPSLVKKEPYLIEHVTGMTLHNRVKKIGAEISQGLDNISNAWNSTWYPSAAAQPQAASLTAGGSKSTEGSSGLFASWFRGQPEAEKKAATPPALANTAKKTSAHAWSSLDGDLEGIAVNQEKRVDYVLQESTLELTNQYMSALFAHSSYFENKDFLLFTLTQIAGQNAKTKITE